ncbi:EcsC family protein [Paenibacillus sp. 1P07SE]|uniref:EcsC family protein n=1 Tax=Paenibacillus sp. 1P07SE TaxID=3132209 RepID=UPI0039A610DD
MKKESWDELQHMLVEIRSWEKDQKDQWFWEKLGRLPFLLLDKLTPRIIQKKISDILNEIGSYVQSGGRYLISERQTVKRIEKQWLSSGDPEAARYRSLSLDEVAVHVPVGVMRQVAADLSEHRTQLATVQGASTGIGGLFTLAADIPAILGLCLKIIQEIALSYGYDPSRQEERIFAVKCLQFASSDIVGKKAILDELTRYGEADMEVAVISQLQGWREVMAAYRDNFGWKKLFQMIPIAGMVFGAFINRGMLKDTAEAAHMLYRRRRVMERLGGLSEEA